MDTNHFKNKGSTDEECCVARSCSQQPGSRSCCVWDRLCGCLKLGIPVFMSKWRFPEMIKWGYPQIIHFSRIFHYQPSIFVRKTPFILRLCRKASGLFVHCAIGALQGTQQSFQASSSVLAAFIGLDKGNICRKP